ncbi:MAG: hypothetical protein ACREK5_02085 [Gemmatimonadota bacterium]
MCPACITTAALALAGGTSAGGLAALVARLGSKVEREGTHAPEPPWD